jgi:membrane associated rhomboid family serine protease
MAPDETDPPIKSWQHGLLMAVQPAGLALLTLWLFWLLIAVVDGHIDGLLGWAQAVLGVVTSVALVFAGAAYRRDLRRRS